MARYLILLSSILLPLFTMGQKTKADKAKDLIYTYAPSDIPDVNFKITYHKEDCKRDYMADTGYITDSEGMDIKVDKGVNIDSGKVYLVFSQKHYRQFFLSHRRIKAIVHVKYDSPGYDKTDVIFTRRRIYMVHSYTDKNKRSIFSDVFIIPKAKTGFEYLKLFSNLEDADQPERDIFYASVLFCQSHKIKI